MIVTLIQGDSLGVLKALPDQSVQCCVTSPPYYGLRRYLPDVVRLKDDAPDWVILELEERGIMLYRKSEIPDNLLTYFEPAEIGLEQTPDEYVAKLVAVFREVRRVLRDDGTLWLVIGSSYANKNKDDLMIPHHVFDALMIDGWYGRQDIIYAKKNPMPESVKDRCTKSHEYIFLLAKSQKYYYDYKAISEKAVTGTDLGLLGSIKAANAHFATFPPDLIEPCILAGSKAGDVILDPFNGAGTTGLVAIKYNRDYIGIDLNPEYIEMTRKRLENVQVEL